LLTASDAEAQTVGMDRRQDRRTGRRDVRRGNIPAATTTGSGGTAPK